MSPETVTLQARDWELRSIPSKPWGRYGVPGAVRETKRALGEQGRRGSEGGGITTSPFVSMTRRRGDAVTRRKTKAEEKTKPEVRIQNVFLTPVRPAEGGTRFHLRASLRWRGKTQETQRSPLVHFFNPPPMHCLSL